VSIAELESVLILHKNVAEAVGDGYSHDIKGQGIYASAYVTLMVGTEPSDKLKQELQEITRTWKSN